MRIFVLVLLLVSLTLSVSARTDGTTREPSVSKQKIAPPSPAVSMPRAEAASLLGSWCSGPQDYLGNGEVFLTIYDVLDYDVIDERFGLRMFVAVYQWKGKAPFTNEVTGYIEHDPKYGMDNLYFQPHERVGYALMFVRDESGEPILNGPGTNPHAIFPMLLSQSKCKK